MTTTNNQNEAAKVTDLAYLANFCDGEERQMKKYIQLYIKAAAVLLHNLDAGIAVAGLDGLAGEVHAFKPKLMMMGMKQTAELGKEIEQLCYAGDSGPALAGLLSGLLEQVKTSLAELEGR